MRAAVGVCEIRTEVSARGLSPARFGPFRRPISCKTGEKTVKFSKIPFSCLDICCIGAILDDVLRFVTSEGRRSGLIPRAGNAGRRLPAGGADPKKNEKFFVLALAKAKNGGILRIRR